MKRPEAQWPTAMAGALEYVGISSLLTVLEMERRTGVLELRAQRRAGRLSLRDGRVVDAELDGARVAGCDAVSLFLTWNAGRFAFRVGEVETVEGSTTPTILLLLEAARRADESAAA